MRVCPAYPDYAVTEDGRVYRVTPYPRCRPVPFEMKQRYDAYGYRVVGPDALKVHRLVALTYMTNPDGLKCVAHNNGVRDDNRLANLRWATHKSNHADMKAHGTKAELEKHPNHKLTVEQVHEARRRAARGETHASIAESMPVDRSVLSRAIRGDTWKAA